MKTSLLFTATLLLCQLLTAQTYQVELKEFPSTPGNAIFWQAENQAPTLKFMATENGFLGNVKKGRIFFEDKYAFSIERKGTQYFLYNESKETQMVGHISAYMALDGTELKRKRSATGERITILHPDGTVLAEGKIKSKILGNHTITLDIKEGLAYSDELAAMLSVDLIETLRHRFDGNSAINYTANSN